MYNVKTFVIYFCCVSSSLAQNALPDQHFLNYHGIVQEFPAGRATSFLGIPYAEPPTGERRFKKPIFRESDENEVNNATEMGPVCMQPIRFKKLFTQLERLDMNEDCLTLNIYVPSNVNKNVNGSSGNELGLPVIVYVHPGDFVSGGGAVIEGTSLALKTNSIVISFNFRLGIFGFFSFNATIPRNLGIWDILTAFKWVNKYVKRFGGDSDNISVLSGHSALKILQTNYMFQELFQKGISFDDGYFETLKTNLKTDLSVYNSIMRRCKSNRIVECLQTFTAPQLLKISDESILEWRTIPFQPIVDDVIIHKLPNQPTESRRNYVSEQLISSLSVKLPRYSIASFWIDQSRSCSKITLQKSISYLLQLFNYKNDTLALTLESFFYPSYPYSQDSFCESIESMLQSFSKIRIMQYASSVSKSSMTFLIFETPAKRKNPSKDDVIKPVCDVAEETGTGNCSEKLEYGMSRMMRSFAHYGYPEIKGVAWRPYTPTNKNHVKISRDRFVSGNHGDWPFKREELFWSQLVTSSKDSQSAASKKLRGNSDRKGISQNVGFGGIEWGMNEKQLEILLFSLILVCLFLVVVTVTLLRIVCYVKGKPILTGQSKSKSTKSTNEQSPYTEVSLNMPCRCNGHPHTMEEHRETNADIAIHSHM